MVMKILEQKFVSGRKNPFQNAYMAVMHYGVWLLIFWKGADAFIVGYSAGEEALAAVGATSTITNLFILVITGFYIYVCSLHSLFLFTKKE